MTEEPVSDATLTYVRAVHADIIETNRSLYARAQIVLTVDGLIIGFFTAVLSSKPDEIRKLVERAGTLTALLAGGAGLCLAISVVSAFMALYSRHLSGRSAQHAGGSIDIHMWFYARIAEIDPATFMARARQIGADEELEIRTQQVSVMAPIMRRRADWINGAYAFAASAFLFQLLAGTSYLIDL